jgi:hypothetical protein
VKTIFAAAMIVLGLAWPQLVRAQAGAGAAFQSSIYSEPLMVGLQLAYHWN